MGFLSKIFIPESCGVTLVELRKMLMDIYKKGRQVIFFTVSPNPNLGCDKTVGKKKIKHTYMNMTHKEQHEYLECYMQTVYVPYLDPEDWMFYIYELNESNNLHVHGLMFINLARNPYDLKSIQKTIFAERMTQANIAKKSIKKIDYMNNIVYLDGDRINEKSAYLFKQSDIKGTFPDTFYSGSTRIYNT